MSIELKMLLYAIILLLLQLVLQTIAGIAQNGLGWALSARDEDPEISGYAGRFERAFYNMLETFPVFAAIVLMVEVTESWNTLTALGAQVYFWSRVAYLPIYVAGIPVIRTLVWAASVVGMCMVAWPMLAPFFAA